MNIDIKPYTVKSPEGMFKQDVIFGYGLSRVEAEALWDYVKNFVKEHYLACRFDNQIIFYAVSAGEPAGKPIKDLVNRLMFAGTESVLEAGCGTGFATVLIADMLNDSAEFTAVDISEGMLLEAHKRARSKNIENIRFIAGDALEYLGTVGLFDVIFSSWTLGYIPLKPFFMRAYNVLKEGGRLAFIVHKEDSPYEQLEIFRKLISKNPSILKKRIAFDFPRDMDHVRDELESAELEVEHLVEGKVVFRYDRPEEVLEHLLKSGAGTVYYDALEASKKKYFEDEFIKSLDDRHKAITRYEVVHDYISCIAQKPNAKLVISAETVEKP